MYSNDPSAAVFIRESTADLIGDRISRADSEVRRYFTTPRNRRGCMQGYEIRLVLTNGHVVPATNGQVERLPAI